MTICYCMDPKDSRIMFLIQFYLVRNLSNIPRITRSGKCIITSVTICYGLDSQRILKTCFFKLVLPRDFSSIPRITRSGKSIITEINPNPENATSSCITTDSATTIPKVYKAGQIACLLSCLSEQKNFSVFLLPQVLPPDRTHYNLV